MKLGVSSYSLFQALKAEEMSILDVIDWVADQGGEHIEIVPLGFDLIGNPELPEQIREKAAARGLDISNYAIGANFLTETEAAYEEEIARVKSEVDIAARLGVKKMRHDVARSEDLSIRNFNAQLPKLAEACRQIADYALQYGIVTSVENHGFFIQHSDRVQALIQAVGRDNFKTTLDIGNFLCVDEQPIAAVPSNLPFASIVHVKDFYIRPAGSSLGEGWFRSTHGTYLRGAIAGHGDIPMRDVLRLVKESGYDGYISLEFEGMEECKKGTRIGLDNIRSIWAELG